MSQKSKRRSEHNQPSFTADELKMNKEEETNMLKIAVIGIGNAGNQVAELAKAKYNVPGVAINSSERDVSTISAVPSIIIGDEKGAGKDRSIAKGFIRTYAKELLGQKDFKSAIEDAEVVFVVSSTGGGTGSGMAPVLTDVMSRVYAAKQFILVGILPPIKESVAAQQNTIDYLKELRQQDPVYMLYDNNNYANLPTKVMLQTVNEEIVKDLVVVRGDYQHATPYNSIDEKDMMKLVETTGRLIVNRVEGVQEKDTDIKSIEQRLIDAIKTGAHVELDRDKIIKRRGLILNLSDKVYETLDTNLPKVEEFVGEPIEGFEHIYVDNDVESRVVAILSGLSVPDDRVEKVVQRIQEAMNALSKTKEKSILDNADTGLVDSLRKTNDNNDATESVNIDDIFSNYMK